MNVSALNVTVLPGPLTGVVTKGANLGSLTLTSAATLFGTPTATTFGRPAIGIAGSPRIGNAAFAMTASGLAPSQPLVCLLGPPDNLPFLGLTLHVQPVVMLQGTSNATGQGLIPLPIPNLPNLVDSPVSTQFFGVDPRLPSLLPLGHTSGLTFTIDR